MQSQYQRIAILGSSRGLGLALAKKLLPSEHCHLWLSSRKILDLEKDPDFQQNLSRLMLFPIDFTHPTAVEATFSSLIEFQPQQIIYCAGGGPYGLFHQKPWRSHLWTFHLNLLFPAQLTHVLLKAKEGPMTELKQIIFVGSSVAENHSDAGAASYSAAKHGLRGLIQSLVEEYSSSTSISPSSPIDLRLFSPHYMNTSLLPKNAKPRQSSNLALAEPETIAQDLLEWSHQPPHPQSWHRVISGSCCCL